MPPDEKPDWSEPDSVGVDADLGEETEAGEPELEPEETKALVRQDSLQRYLTEVRRYPLLSPEEEHEHAVRYKELGDVQAAYRLVTANLRLVVMIARRYERTFQNLLDLIQEGNVGLMEAVKKFDPYRGIRFPSYAVWWIRAYIIRYIMNNFRMVKMGTTQAQRKLFFNLQKEKQRLEAEGFDFSPKLLASRLDVKPSEVTEMEQRMAARDLSVDAPVGEGEDASMLDFLSSGSTGTEESVVEADYRERLTAKIREFGVTLEGKDQTIFEQRLVAEDPRTLQEIGDDYGISRERVRQIEERLRNRLREFLLRAFPDLREVEVVDALDERRRSERAARQST